MSTAYSKPCFVQVERLLEAKANIECRDAKTGKTPFIFAAANGYEYVVYTLYKYKANIRARDIDGYDALYHACKGT
jgi:ankyrin repeat protein